METFKQLEGETGTFAESEHEQETGLTASRFHLRRFDGAEGLQALYRDWDKLARTLTPHRFFHRYDWYKSYMDTLEDDPQSVHFFAVYRHGALFGIVPLKASVRQWHGLPLRTLNLPDHVHMDLRDGVFGPCAETA